VNTAAIESGGELYQFTLNSLLKGGLLASKVFLMFWDIERDNSYLIYDSNNSWKETKAAIICCPSCAESEAARTQNQKLSENMVDFASGLPDYQCSWQYGESGHCGD
jgi:hypothetical protein